MFGVLGEGDGLDAEFLFPIGNNTPPSRLLPQPDHAAVVELAQRDEDQREQQASRITPLSPPADIYRRERGQRVKPDLIAQQLRLRTAAHKVRHAPS